MTVRRVARTTGFEEFSRLLTLLPQRVENRLLGQAVRSAIAPGLAAVKSASPVAKRRSKASKEYGRMKGKIRSKSTKWRAKGVRAAEVHTGKAFYSTFYELGTRRQKARPFIAKNFLSRSDEMIRRLTAILGSGIVQEVLALRGNMK